MSNQYKCFTNECNFIEQLRSLLEMSFVSKDKDFEIEYIFLFDTLYEETFDLLISYCNVEEKQLLEFVIGFMEYK